jgi:hypothetical protein
MTDTAPVQLTMVGDATAEVCDGDVCIIPPHPEHGIMARRLDEDLVRSGVLPLDPTDFGAHVMFPEC